MSDYDILQGGMSKLIKDIEKKREDILRFDKELSMEIAVALVDTIKSEAQSIDNEQMRTAVIEGTRIEVRDNEIVVTNDTQHATYSEFGTGMIGAISPHPNPIGWEYDVNNHGNKGWRYQYNGLWYFTRGVPSNPVFLRSSELIRSRLPYIYKRKLGGNDE